MFCFLQCECEFQGVGLSHSIGHHFADANLQPGSNIPTLESRILVKVQEELEKMFAAAEHHQEFSKRGISKKEYLAALNLDSFQEDNLYAMLMCRALQFHIGILGKSGLIWSLCSANSTMMLNVFVGQVNNQGTNIYLPLEQMGDVEVEFGGVLCSVGCAKLAIVQLVQEHLEENPCSGVSPEKDETLSGLLQLPIVTEVFSSQVCPRAPKIHPCMKWLRKFIKNYFRVWRRRLKLFLQW